MTNDRLKANIIDWYKESKLIDWIESKLVDSKHLYKLGLKLWLHRME